MNFIRPTLLALIALGILSGCGRPEGRRVKLGFVVNAPDQPWYQLEWKFADQAAKDLGFELIRIGAPEGDKALAAIDTLAAAGAQGLVICTPDVRLGPAIVAKAKAAGLKLMAVDDQFVGPHGSALSRRIRAPDWRDRRADRDRRNEAAWLAPGGDGRGDHYL